MTTLQLARDCERLTARYIVRPSRADNVHHNAAYVCVVHCDCPDHYYRARDCKHVKAWLLLYDVGKRAAQ